MDGFLGKAEKESHLAGLIATLAEKTRRQEEKSASHVAEKKARREQNIHLVGQHLVLAAHQAKDRNGVRNQKVYNII